MPRGCTGRTGARSGAAADDGRAVRQGARVQISGQVPGRSVARMVLPEGRGRWAAGTGGSSPAVEACRDVGGVRGRARLKGH